MAYQHIAFGLGPPYGGCWIGIGRMVVGWILMVDSGRPPTVLGVTFDLEFRRLHLASQGDPCAEAQCNGLGTPWRHISKNSAFAGLDHEAVGKDVTDGPCQGDSFVVRHWELLQERCVSRCGQRAPTRCGLVPAI